MDRVDKDTRNRWIFGDDFAKLESAKVVIFGLGGVGGHTLDALWRSGVRNILAVDFDKFDITNQNRQLLSHHIDRYKAEVFAEHYSGIEPLIRRADQEWIAGFDFSKYDLVLDCIDDVPAKVAIVKFAHKKLISSMGAAKRTDPTLIRVADIWQTSNDPFARIVKKRLKYEKIKHNYKVIYSMEAPKKISNLGSFVGVTGSFGLIMASEAIKKLTAP